MEEDLEILEEMKFWEGCETTIDAKWCKALENLLTRYKKQDKVINEMAEYIKNPYIVRIFGSRKPKTEIIIEYFTNKVEREGK